MRVRYLSYVFLMEGCKGWLFKRCCYKPTQLFRRERLFIEWFFLLLTLGAHPMQCIITLQLMNRAIVFKDFVLCMAVLIIKREMHK
jgi:hypothetical protein